MSEDALSWVGALLSLLGALLFLAAAIGLLRLPDFYTRTHAPTKAATLGLLPSREEKEKMKHDVSVFVSEVVTSSGLTEEDQIQMTTRVTALGDGPSDPITAGLLNEGAQQEPPMD